MKPKIILSVVVIVTIAGIFLAFNDPATRLRLLGLSLFCSGAAAALAATSIYITRLIRDLSDLKKTLFDQVDGLSKVKDDLEKIEPSWQDEVATIKNQSSSKDSKVDTGKLVGVTSQQTEKLQISLDRIERLVVDLKSQQVGGGARDGCDRSTGNSRASDYDRRVDSSVKNTQSYLNDSELRGLSFPISVTECLRYLNGIKAEVEGIKPEPLRNGIFVRMADGIFLMVKDTDSYGSRYLVFPKVEKFSTKQDYYTYYQNYYHCDNPSGGEVWIVKPAAVTAHKDIPDLKLTEKGELQIK
jgi:hypothetical protein